MIETVNKYTFIKRFEDMNRVGETGNFSYRGLELLYDYFEEIEEETQTQLELDVIAICCEYTEYDSIEEAEKDGYSQEDIIIQDEDVIIVRE